MAGPRTSFALLCLALASAACRAPHGSSDAPVKEDVISSSQGTTELAAATVTVVQPTVVSPPDIASRPLRVLVGGDVLPHRPSLVAPASIRAALAPLGPLFKTADATLANYEAATGEVDKKSFRMAYAAPAGWLEELGHAGITAVTVANNHACDLGLDGVDATLAAAESSNVTAIGGDPKDAWAPRVVAERDGKRICALGWTTLVNAEGGCSRTIKLAHAPLDRRGKATIETAMARARSTCDATIAIIHGGVEYVPQTRQVMDQARYAVDAGADAVVVHHPHIASPVVVHTTRDGRKAPIFASVGNLVTNQGESWKAPMFPVLRENRRLVCVNGWTRLGVMADLAFSFEKPETADNAEKIDKTEMKLDWGFHLVWVDNEHAIDRSAPVPKIEARLLDPEKDDAIISRLADDEVGPVELFDDPCWVERPIYTPGDRDPSVKTRCEMTRSAKRTGDRVAHGRPRAPSATRNASGASKHAP